MINKWNISRSNVPPHAVSVTKEGNLLVARGISSEEQTLNDVVVIDLRLWCNRENCLHMDSLFLTMERVYDCGWTLVTILFQYLQFSRANFLESAVLQSQIL